jgi:hypothetical protein
MGWLASPVKRVELGAAFQIATANNHNRNRARKGGSERKDDPGRAAQKSFAALYNHSMATVPAEIHGQKYISLATFRKSGVAVHTPIWFAEDNNKLYFLTNAKMAKCKRIRNNPNVKIAPCTIRGKIIGPEFSATARFLPPEEYDHARRLMGAKYWLARVPFFWRNSIYLEITPA